MREHHIRRTILWAAALLLALLVCPGTALGDAQDEAMARLSVMSQQDEAFAEVAYNGGFLPGRGCQPVSVANALIASLGIEDRETAIGLVKEATQALVVDHMRGEGRMELTRIPLLLSAQERRRQAQEYPQLAAQIGSRKTEITALETDLDAQMVAEYFVGRQQAAMLVGGQTVHPDWTPLLSIIECLDGLGLRDATLCLASVGVGRKDSGAPLASGQNGHYLSIFIHVGTFVEDGRVYVLDSLPRALRDEESGFAHEMHEAYPFARKWTPFSQVYDAARISSTILRLTQKETDAWQAASLEEKARMMKTMLLYGPGVLMIRVPDRIQ